MSFGQGGPYGPGGSQQPPSRQSQTPDWAAMADHSATRGRRRRWLFVGGAVLATAAVGTMVATAVVSSNDKGGSSDDTKSRLPSQPTLPRESESPEPTFSHVAPPAPPKPLDILSDAKRDKAPLSAKTLFPDEEAAREGRSYAQGATASTASCSAGTQGALASVLSGNGCRKLLRATFARDGVAVTIGVAVFDARAAAEKAKDGYKPNVASLPGAGVPSFCRQTACRTSANAIGRYAYFTISGYTSGKTVTASDTKALEAGRDLADYTFRRILARGNAQASAAAGTTG